MSNKTFVVSEALPSETCKLCAKLAELRPYGPNKENICFECAMLDPVTTEYQFKLTFRKEQQS